MKYWSWQEWLCIFLFILSLCGLVFSIGLVVYCIEHY